MTSFFVKTNHQKVVTVFWHYDTVYGIIKNTLQMFSSNNRIANFRVLVNKSFSEAYYGLLKILES